MKYNHAYSLGFSLESEHHTGEDVTGKDLRQAILKFLTIASDEELLENCGCPWDTYEIEEPEREYLVSWRIDIGAINAEEAAARALIVMRDQDPENTATVFDVTDKKTALCKTVDLNDD